ncbi:MAG: exodeoxyribonuclease V subunit alpha [Propionibacteriaceae bacterium]|nr:exodeoxyribonuclease V subunit alpha [Propionibacteriaceae bacterium]
MTLLERVEASGLVTASTARLARHLGYLYGEDREPVIVAAACAIAALSAGSVCFNLDQAGDRLPDADPLVGIGWPETEDWVGVLRSSPMVSMDLAARDRPLTLDQQSVYLTRYWAEQDRIVDRVRARLQQPPPPPVEQARLDLFFEPDSPHRQAATMVATSRLAVIAGGPGTGKTTAVARILAALSPPASPSVDPSPPIHACCATPASRTSGLKVILTAPTGRAAARLEQAVREGLAQCPCQDFAVSYTSGTLHRVLGLKPWGGSVFDATHPLSADVVVVDEASMLSLHLMALLLDAIGKSTRLILVGDPDQLASVDAGAVLADIVDASPVVPVTRLRHTFRFSGAIAALAEAIRRGEAEQALSVLEQGSDQIDWIPVDLESQEFSPDALTSLRRDITGQGLALSQAALAGNVPDALNVLGSHRLLLAHRHGISGVSHWTAIVRQWLSRDLGTSAAADRWHPGMPLLITRNDDLLNIHNGDCGVIVSGDQGLLLAVDDGTGTRLISPGMIQSWEPLYASTIHKAQGSQYETVSLILPVASTALLTRELFYTAVTRATTRLRVIGSREAVISAVESPALRASGLAAQLIGLAVPLHDQPVGDGRGGGQHDLS